MVNSYSNYPNTSAGVWEESEGGGGGGVVKDEMYSNRTIAIETHYIYTHVPCK